MSTQSFTSFTGVASVPVGAARRFGSTAGAQRAARSIDPTLAERFE